MPTDVPAVPDRLEVALPRGARVLVCSDLHLPERATAESRTLAAELSAALAEIASGAAALVLNGDCFELLADEHATPDRILDAHPALTDAIAAFVRAEPGCRHVIVTAGNHDGRLAWDEAAAAAVTRRLHARVALAVDLVLGTDQGPRVVRVEHGHRFDPANAFVDPRDPNDTPLGHHVVRELLPDLTDRPFLRDAAALSDPRDGLRLLGSRLVYRQLASRAWWLLVPFLFALLVRTPLLVRAFSSARQLQRGERWLGVLAVGAAVDLVVITLVLALVSRRVFDAIASTRLAQRGGAQNEPPRAAAEALCGQGFAGYVTGHTHHPELSPIGRGFYANSGCGVVAVESVPARLRLPPVFRGVHRRSWVHLEGGRTVEARLVLAETPRPGGTRLERMAAHRAPARPSTPTVVAAHPDGGAFPVASTRLTAAARRAGVRRLAAALAIATALVNLLSALTPPLHERLRIVLELMPVELPQAASAALAFVSVALLLLARGLRRGLRYAWTVTLVLLGAAVLLNVGKGGDIEEAVIGLGLAVWLSVRREAFRVRLDTGAWRRAARVALLLPVGAIAASLVLVETLGAHRRSGVRESVRALAERLAGKNAIPLPSASGFVTPALFAAGIATVFAAGWRLLAPRRPHDPTPSDERADRARARAIVAAHGGDTLAYFALRDDKSYFFAGNSVVAYAVRNGVCLVSPDPIGPPEERPVVWGDFTDWADAQGWSIAVVGSHEGWLPVYQAGGLRPIYMGDEAIVDCTSFTLDGGTMKSLRGAYNRVVKAGYTVEVLDPADAPESLREELLALLGQSRRGEVERGFSMTLGRLFDPDDRGLLLAVARGPDGKAAAFCQYVPSADIDGYSLDLMRRSADPDLPNGVTDFVVIETIKHLHDRHRWGLALNFAVLRAVLAGEAEVTPFAELERRVLRKFSESMQIESLWKYNQKFRPFWRPRYVLVEAPELLAAQGFAIAGAESIWELPVIGRFMSAARAPHGGSPPAA